MIRSQAVATLSARLVGLLALAGAWRGPAPAAASGSAVVIRNFPAVQQWYSLSCEYAAAAAVTLYWDLDNVVSQRDFMREVPRSPNPHWGFRGNINGPIGGITHYGVYAEPLVPVLERHGYDATVFYGDLGRLKANLRSGNPIVVWTTTGRQERPLYTGTYQGARFRLVPGEHAVVAYGYDGYGVYVMDVGDGNYYHPDWASFLRRWSYFDQMALVITPQ